MRLVHSLTPDELADACRSVGQPVFRASQIWRWLYVQQVDTWDAMTNLPAALRQGLSERYSLQAATVVERSGRLGDTCKLLVAFQDGERVEAVLIPARNRLTVCISSQAGCRFACAFCASGQAGFRRNLVAGEMVGQVLCAMREADEPVTHVVFMGIGEPLDNAEEVLKAVRILNDADGLNIGARRITISTSGVIPGIERLAEAGIQFELSVSLHAPDNGLRSRLMPINRTYPLADLLTACRTYVERTGRIITFEYTMIRDLNDTSVCLRELIACLRDISCRVNLIPLSPVEGFEGRASDSGAMERFARELTAAGIHTTVRASRGAPIHAACGQLRYRKAASPAD